MWVSVALVSMLLIKSVDFLGLGSCLLSCVSMRQDGLPMLDHLLFCHR